MPRSDYGWSPIRIVQQVPQVGQLEFTRHHDGVRPAWIHPCGTVVALGGDEFRDDVTANLFREGEVEMECPKCGPSMQWHTQKGTRP